MLSQFPIVCLCYYDKADLVQLLASMLKCDLLILLCGFWRRYMRILSGLLRICFRWLYHTFAWAYDFVAAVVSLGQWRSWVVSILPYLTGPRVLELGYGPGHLQAGLLAEGHLTYGLDESCQMGSLARKRLLRNGFVPGLTRGLAQALPYPAGIFNQVVATFPSEYIFDPQTVLELYRVLAPGGEAVVLIMAWITTKRWYGRLAAWYYRILGLTTIKWDERYFEPLRRIGFQCVVEQISHKSSTLLVLHLKKL
jgi:ubiquinone/menaquinone biosynthesis C-methylase UbiE